MSEAVLNNVNFQLLLKQHGGNFPRAKAAWDKILSLGGFGDVPFHYEGGLDVGGLRVLLDEQKQGQAQAVAMNIHHAAQGGQAVAFEAPVPSAASDLEDRIKKIEDLANGDDPKGSWRDGPNDTPPQGDWK